MREILPTTTELLTKEAIRDNFSEWCRRNRFRVPDNPLELLNGEKLTAAQREYVWSVIDLLS